MTLHYRRCLVSSQVMFGWPVGSVERLESRFSAAGVVCVDLRILHFCELLSSEVAGAGGSN